MLWEQLNLRLEDKVTIRRMASRPELLLTLTWTMLLGKVRHLWEVGLLEPLLALNPKRALLWPGSCQTP